MFPPILSIQTEHKRRRGSVWRRRRIWTIVGEDQFGGGGGGSRRGSERICLVAAADLGEGRSGRISRMAEAMATVSSFYPHERKKLKYGSDLGYHGDGDGESVGSERADYSLPPPPAPLIRTTSIYDHPIFEPPHYQPLPPLEPAVSELLTVVTLYDHIDLRFARAGRQVYRGHYLDDKVYLFLFCELKGVDAHYQQVVADKDIIDMWWIPNRRLEFCRLMNSSNKSIPNSVILAEQIIAEKNLQLGSRDLLECLKDLCAIWGREQKQLGYKKYEEFLLNFWTENHREPTLEEIGAKYCTGPTRVAGSRRKFCTTSACANPVSGKDCVGLTAYSIEILRKNLFEKLSRGDPAEECLELIEENYKNRMSEPYPCRANYIKLKLHEAEKTGLAEKLRELVPSYKGFAVRNLDMDQEKLDLGSAAATV